MFRQNRSFCQLLPKRIRHSIFYSPLAVQELSMPLTPVPGIVFRVKPMSGSLLEVTQNWSCYLHG